MFTNQEFVRLHALQSRFAIRRDWVAVAHLQALIDHVAFASSDLGECAPIDDVEVLVH